VFHSPGNMDGRWATLFSPGRAELREGKEGKGESVILGLEGLFFLPLSLMVERLRSSPSPPKGPEETTQILRKSLPKVRWEGPAATPFPP